MQYYTSSTFSEGQNSDFDFETFINFGKTRLIQNTANKLFQFFNFLG